MALKVLTFKKSIHPRTLQRDSSIISKCVFLYCFTELLIQQRLESFCTESQVPLAADLQHHNAQGSAKQNVSCWSFFLSLKGGAAMESGKGTWLLQMQFFCKYKWDTGYLMAEHKLITEIGISWVRSHNYMQVL